jgi:sirohydrochlorin ferrochelatase
MGRRKRLPHLVSTGIVIFAHGSSVASANEAVHRVAADAAAAGPFHLYETAFLEAAPGLPEAVQKLVERGASRILVVPYFLTLGIHLQRDLPVIVERLSHIHNDMEIQVTPPLDGHQALAAILVDRIREAQ